MINYWRHHWYYIGMYGFAAFAFILIFWGDRMERLQVILIASYMAMIVHQYEEYAWPGGFPSISNYVSMKGIMDRYPINANQGWISNVFLTFIFYMVPVFFPHAIWLGLGQVLAGVLQLPAHGILINSRLRSFYNPGLGATVFLQTPIAIYYIWYVYTQGLASGAGIYCIGLLTALAGMIFAFGAPILLMKNRESEYPFYEEECYGFAEKKIREMQKQDGIK